MLAYPVALVLFIVTWFSSLRFPRGVKAIFGGGMVAVAAFYMAAQTAESHSLTGSVALVGGTMLSGGLVYLIGITGKRGTRLGNWLEIIGLALLAVVFALPSTLVLGLPVIAVIIASAIRQARTTPESHVA